MSVIAIAGMAKGDSQNRFIDSYGFLWMVIENYFPFLYNGFVGMLT